MNIIYLLGLHLTMPCTPCPCPGFDLMTLIVTFHDLTVRHEEHDKRNKICLRGRVNKSRSLQWFVSDTC
jgi:hypothetical protein